MEDREYINIEIKHLKESVEKQISYAKESFEKDISHLKNFMLEHDKSTELAISKSEANYNERFLKNNEFREQLKDMINTLARQKETDDAIAAIYSRMEQNTLSVTLRYEANSKAINEKIDFNTTHFSEIIASLKQSQEEKRDALLISLEQKITANLKSETDKFIAVDKSMKVQIDANADISNAGLIAVNKRIDALTTRNDIQDGRMIVINKIMGILIGVGMLIIGAYIYSLFR